MVLALTEEQKKHIESCGHFVVEVKMELKKAHDYIFALINQIKKTICKAVGIITDNLDDLHTTVENVNHNSNAKEKTRYKMANIVSKCSGIERKRFWKMAKPAYLARSRC